MYNRLKNYRRLRFSRVYGLIFFLVLSTLHSKAQNRTNELVAACGDEFKGEGITLEWSLGELITETFEGENYSITQGFNQAIYNLTSTKCKRKYQNITLYPNPCSGHFLIDLKMENFTEFGIRIIDITGKTVLVDQFTENINRIDIQSLKGNIYFVQVLNTKNKVIYTSKLKKM